jgi:hypothetical protein
MLTHLPGCNAWSLEAESPEPFALFFQVGQRCDVVVNPLGELLASVPEAEQPGIWEELTTVAQALGGNCNRSRRQ